MLWTADTAPCSPRPHDAPRQPKVVYTQRSLLIQRQTQRQTQTATTQVQPGNETAALCCLVTQDIPYCCCKHTSAPGVRVTTGDTKPRAGASSARHEATIPAENMVRYMYRMLSVWRWCGGLARGAPSLKTSNFAHTSNIFFVSQDMLCPTSDIPSTSKAMTYNI